MRHCLIILRWRRGKPSFSCQLDSLWTVKGILSWCFDYHPCMDCRGCGSAAASCHNSPCAYVPRESWEIWVLHQSYGRAHPSLKRNHTIQGQSLCGTICLDSQNLILQPKFNLNCLFTVSKM